MSLTEFDKKLHDLQKNADPGETPRGVVDAAVYVNDTLELAWASVQSVFGEEASPEQAIAVYDRINTERLRRLAEKEPKGP